MVEPFTSVSENKNRTLSLADKRDAERFQSPAMVSKENNPDISHNKEDQSNASITANTSNGISAWGPSSIAATGSPIKYQINRNLTCSPISEHTSSKEEIQHATKDENNTSDIDQLISDNAEYKGKISLLLQQLDSKSEEVDKLKQQSYSQNNQIAELQTQLTAKDKLIQNNSANKKQLELCELFGIPIGKIISDECQNINETTTDILSKSLNKALKDAYPQVLDFLTVEYERKYETISNDNNLLRDQNSLLTKHNDSLKEENKILMCENDTLRDKQEVSTDQSQDFTNQLESLKEENHSLKKQIEELTNANDSLTKQTEELTEQTQELNQQIEQSTKQNDSLNQEKDSLKEEKDKLVDKIQSISDDFAKKLESVHSSNDAKLIEMNNKYEQLLNELSKEKSQVEILERELQGIKGSETQKLTYGNLQQPKITLKTYKSLKFELLEKYDMVQLQNMVKMNSLEFGVPIDKLPTALRRNTVLLELFGVLLKYTDWLCTELLEVDFGFREIVEECIRIYMKTGDKRKAKDRFNEVIYEMEGTCIKAFDNLDEYND